MAEAWKDIDGYEGLYRISSDGAVLGVKRNVMLKPFVSKWGYEIVSLSKDGKVKKEQVHRLVARHFVDNPNGFDVVDHIDGNKRNNVASNLEWCTAKENTNRAFEKGLCESCKAASRRTGATVLPKYREKQKKKIIAEDLFTGETRIYESMSDCARAIGTSVGNISATIKGAQGRKQVAGFRVDYWKGDANGK